MQRVGRQWRDPSELMYVENGAVYICAADTLIRYKTYRVPPFTPHLMSEKNSLDVDTLEDWDACVKFLPEFLGQ
jgi:CMP-N-acetylneuraminic acid synthetase